MTRRTIPSALLLLMWLGSVAAAPAQETKIKWFGNAAFSITTPKGKILLIDPWLTNPSNPEGKDGKDPLATVPKVDYILLTHGHRDHVGGALPGIAQDANSFAAELRKLKLDFYEMKPGETITFRRRQKQ